MRFGYWLPVFGGWLRNVDDESMPTTFDYVKRLAQRSEEIGYGLTLVAELNLNDIKGTQAPSLDAWSTAASLAAVTSTLELMVAVRPTFHEPALLAKQASNIDHISGGRLTLNVVSSWWAEEAKQYGVQFDRHDERYARTREWLAVVDGLWSQPQFSFKGRFYNIENAILEPKPSRQPRPTIYAGGESETARDLISNLCDAYVMHGDAPDIIGRRITDMSRRRERFEKPPMTYGVAAYAIVHDPGRAINPAIVEGQLQGGAVQGIAAGLLEEIVYDAEGQLLTGSLMDYALPRADVLPALPVTLDAHRSAINPLGVKGVGESGAIGGAAAIANAIEDAVADLGVTIHEIPVTPARLWTLLAAARDDRG